jgi:hypothetical protein
MFRLQRGLFVFGVQVFDVIFPQLARSLCVLLVASRHLEACANNVNTCAK